MQAMVDPETILTEMTSRVFLHTLFYYLDFFRHLLLYVFFMVSFLCDISGPFFKVHIHWNFRYVSRLFVIPLLKSGTRICTNGAEFMCLRHSFLCQYIVHKYVTCFGKHIVRKILNMSSLRLNITWRSWICKPWIYWSKKFTCPFWHVPVTFIRSDGWITCHGFRASGLPRRLFLRWASIFEQKSVVTGLWSKVKDNHCTKHFDHLLEYFHFV